MVQLPREGIEPLTILVVEESPIARQSIARLAGSHGHTVVGAADASEAWARLAQHPVDVVLADWPAGNTAGPDLLRRLRAREADGAPYTAVLLLIAPSARPAVPGALRAGADGWLARPVDEASLAAGLLAAGRVVTLERRLRASEALVLEQAATLREEVRRDALTHLGNRIRLDEDLRRLRGRAQRYGHRAGAVMLGVDQFRRYTEAMGGTGADDLLRQVAKAVRGGLRDADSAYRFSGDRLLILLPEQDEPGAVVVAERCRSAVAGLRLLHPRSDIAGIVTLSAGVAELRGPDREAVDDWLHRAEQALDAARAAGGNRVARGEHTRVAEPDRDRAG